MKTLGKLFLVVLAVAIGSCTDDAGIKGSLTLSLTDSPADADNVSGVNLYISGVDAKINGEWKSLQRYQQLAGINVLEYTGGKSFALVDQFLDPGKFTQLRLSLNLADINNSLIRNPQCNVALTDGTSRPIYYFDLSTSDLLIDQEFIIKSRSHTDLTFDFEVRKSLQIDANGNYVMKPVIRVVETAKSGNLAATTTNNNATERLVVFAYAAGAFTSAEADTPTTGEVRFSHSITSAKVLHGKFGLGFLEEGSYDLIFIRQSETGEYLGIKGRLNGSAIRAGETLDLDIDLSDLTGA